MGEYRLGFLGGFGSACVSFYIAGRYFPENLGLAVCALTALALSPFMLRVLERNRLGIWDEQRSSYQVNAVTAYEFTTCFLGILLGFLCIAALFFSDLFHLDQSLSERYHLEFYPLFFHNLKVLIACLVFSLVYRAGGLMMVLAWNALHWSQSFAELLSNTLLDSLGLKLLVAFAILPHLVLEVVAYVLAGMAGIFVARAVSKYSLGSDQLTRVSVACLLLNFWSALLLVLASGVEVWLPRTVLAWLV